MGKTTGKKHRYGLVPLHWSAISEGRYYPFGLRAAKAEVLMRVGRWPELEKIYSRDLELARAEGLKEREAYLMARQSKLCSRRSQHQWAGELMGKAAEIYRELGNKEELDRCEDALAGVYISLGEYRQAEFMIDRSLERARNRGDSPALGKLLNNKAVTCKRQGRLEEAAALLGERLALAKNEGQIREEAISLMNLGSVRIDQGLFQEAYVLNLQCAAISRQIGDIFNLYYAVYNMAKACEWSGRPEEALKLYHQDLALARQLGDGPGEATIVGDLSRLQGQQDGKH